jgi:hypothetical protein
MSKLFKLLIPLFVICHLSFAICFAATQADIKKYPSVSGEIYGQAAPGVKSVSVNGKPVAFDADQNFRAPVKLAAGEKYLVMRINYEGLRIIKKYLIVRKSAVNVFKVFVPREKIEKSLEEVKAAKKAAAKKKAVRARPKVKKPVAKAKTPAVRKPTAKKPVVPPEAVAAVPTPAPTTPMVIPASKPITQKPFLPGPRTFEYLYVWEFSEGKLLAVKEKNGKYSADIYIPVEKQWLNLKGLSEQDLKELIEKPVKK